MGLIKKLSILPFNSDYPVLKKQLKHVKVSLLLLGDKFVALDKHFFFNQKYEHIFTSP